jgi:hypothetical protein
MNVMPCWNVRGVAAGARGLVRTDMFGLGCSDVVWRWLEEVDMTVLCFRREGEGVLGL